MLLALYVFQCTVSYKKVLQPPIFTVWDVIEGLCCNANVAFFPLECKSCEHKFQQSGNSDSDIFAPPYCPTCGSSHISRGSHMPHMPGTHRTAVKEPIDDVHRSLFIKCCNMS
jgi:hypothetical protein